MSWSGRQRRAGRAVVRDTVLVAGLAVSTAILAQATASSAKVRSFYDATQGEPFSVGLIWWSIAAAVLLGALFLRRRWPVPAYFAALAAVVLHALAGLLPPLPADYAVLVCLFAVADRCPRRTSVPLAGCGIAAAGLAPQAAAAANPFLPWHSVTLAGIVLLLIAWTAGDSARTRRAYLAEVQARADKSEQQRVLETRLAVGAERERIARELHDVIAHGLSVMIVQTQGANAALGDDLDQAREALHSVLSTGRQALADMRRLVRIVREDSDQSGLDPAPGYDHLAALAGQMRKSGLLVSLAVMGEPVRLDPATDLSVFRVVQEALTNVLKHAKPGATAQVQIGFADDAVEVAVTNTGSPVRGSGPGGDPGLGLVGMRERTRLLGGHFEAGPAARGGFRVYARFPLTGACPAGGR